jgi:hypothetical protein
VIQLKQWFAYQKGSGAPRHCVETRHFAMFPLLPFPLAHGALGPLDEFFVLIAVGSFLVMLVAPSITAMFNKDKDSENTEDSQHVNSAQEQAEAAPLADQRPDHFRLD